MSSNWKDVLCLDSLLEGVKAHTVDALRSKADQQFCFWQVERLLNSAADLLDRALGEKARYVTLRSQAFQLQQELTRAELEIQQAEARLLAYEDGANAGDLQVARIELQQSDMNTESDLHGYINAQLTLANVNSMVALSKENGDAGAKMRAEAETHRSTAEVHRHTIAAMEAARQKAMIPKELRIARDERTRQLLQVKQQRDLFEKKCMETLHGGALSFSDIANQALRKMDRDFSEAAARLYAADKGLREIYDSSIEAVPRFSVDDDASLLDRIDEASQWVRRAIHEHALLIQRDQSLTLCIPLKSALDAASWNTFKKGNLTSFKLPHDSLMGWNIVRLRGMVGVWYGTGGCLPIALRVWVPKFGKIGERLSPIDQREIPSCFLGRVEHYSVPREPEVCGAVSQMNASPIGWASGGEDECWRVSLERFPLEDVELEDVHLQLQLVGIPTRNSKLA